MKLLKTLDIVFHIFILVVIMLAIASDEPIWAIFCALLIILDRLDRLDFKYDKLKGGD